MHKLDIFLTHGINSIAGNYAVLDLFMTGITYVGVPCMILWTAVQWWSPGKRLFRRHVAISAGLSFILGLLINQMVLLFVHRLRPYDAGITSLLISPTTDPSFPSDHATASFAICFSFLAKQENRDALLLAIVSVLVCLSRVYVGTHYVTDVLGGMLTGLIAVLIVRRVYGLGSRLDLVLTRLL